MNINIKKHLVDLMPIFVLPGIFKYLILPNWNNVALTNQVIIDPTKTVLQFAGFVLMMFVLHLWKRAYDRKPKGFRFITCQCGEKFANDSQFAYHLAQQVSSKGHKRI